ncbi:MAG TPA: hypothetical protein VFQ35_07985 [Polyangiaceae bacterium]|nr:hypothetical protein [Polyangiaceae bacterium]
MSTGLLLAAVGFLGTPALPQSMANAGARLEARVRQTPVGAGERRLALDLDATATGDISFTWRRTSLGFGYAPRFTVTDVFDRGSKDLLHNAGINFGWQGRRLSLGVSEYASYGRRWFSLTEPTATNPMTGLPVITAIPAPTSVLFVSLQTTLSARYQLSRRSILGASATYGISGGVDEESRRAVPLLKGPSATLQLEYHATRSDTVGPELSVAYTRATIAQPEDRTIVSGYVSGLGFWSRRWSHRVSSRLAGGVTVQRRFEPTQRVKVFPSGGAGFDYTVPWGGNHWMATFSANATLGSVVNMLTGELQQTASAFFLASWTRFRWTLHTSVGALRPIGRAGGDITLVFADAGSHWGFTRALGWDVGIRAGTQSTGRSEIPAASGTQIGVFTALSFTMPPHRL